MLYVLSAVGLTLPACSSPSGGQLEVGSGGNADTGSPDAAESSSGSGGDQAGGNTGGGSAVGGSAGDSDGAAGTAGDTSTDAGEEPVGTDSGVVAAPACVFHTDDPVPVLALEDDGGDTADGMPGVSDDGGLASDAGSNDGGIATTDGPTTSDGSSASDARAPRDAAAGDSAAGDGGPVYTISVSTSAFVGPYLTDTNGRTLYTYGGDLAGTCTDQPVENCEADCLISWPKFDTRTRTLPPSLNDGMFGSIQRPDGSYQTTYYGWPLYYYKTDTAAGMLNGQGKAKTWFVATVIPPSVVILKGPTAAKYLADGTGRTLYSFAQDTKGTGNSDPVVACTGACADNYLPFRKNRLSFVSPLEPTDFSIFVRGDGLGQQVAYKGAPLYYSAADTRSGDSNGAALPDWAVISQ